MYRVTVVGAGRFGHTAPHHSPSYEATPYHRGPRAEAFPDPQTNHSSLLRRAQWWMFKGKAL